MSVQPNMVETDADLGYMLRYIRALHNFLENGNTLPDHAVQNVRTGMDAIRNAFLNTHHTLPRPVLPMKRTTPAPVVVDEARRIAGL